MNSYNTLLCRFLVWGEGVGSKWAWPQIWAWFIPTWRGRPVIHSALVPFWSLVHQIRQLSTGGVDALLSFTIDSRERLICLGTHFLKSYTTEPWEPSIRELSHTHSEWKIEIPFTLYSTEWPLKGQGDSQRSPSWSFCRLWEATAKDCFYMWK